MEIITTKATVLSAILNPNDLNISFLLFFAVAVNLLSAAAQLSKSPSARQAFYKATSLLSGTAYALLRILWKILSWIEDRGVGMSKLFCSPRRYFRSM